MPETGPFSFKIDVHGACVVSDRYLLHSACKSDGEVDFHIRQLKEYLDRVGAQMKQAVKDDKDKRSSLRNQLAKSDTKT